MELSGQLNPMATLLPGSVSLHVVEKRKIPCPCRESNPSCPACNLVTILTAIQAPSVRWQNVKLCIQKFSPLSLLSFGAPCPLCIRDQ